MILFYKAKSYIWYREPDYRSTLLRSSVVVKEIGQAHFFSSAYATRHELALTRFCSCNGCLGNRLATCNWWARGDLNPHFLAKTRF